jgi:hypothetical protein
VKTDLRQPSAAALATIWSAGGESVMPLTIPYGRTKRRNATARYSQRQCLILLPRKYFLAGYFGFADSTKNIRRSNKQHASRDEGALAAINATAAS